MGYLYLFYRDYLPGVVLKSLCRRGPLVPTMPMPPPPKNVPAGMADSLSVRVQIAAVYLRQNAGVDRLSSYMNPETIKSDTR